jgi:hypothetical protein
MTRGAKAAASESIFRDVNERVVEIDRAHGVPTDELASFLCECAQTSCIERVALSTTDYERIRAHGTWFVVLPGHDEPDVERIVEQTESYVVVEKQGEAGEVAEQRDPRD